MNKCARTLAVLIAALASAAFGQTTPLMPFGEPDDFPPAILLPEVTPRTIDLLTAALEKRPPVHIRVQLLGELAQCDDPRAMPPVRAALKDADPSVRAAAVLAAAKLSDRESIAAIPGLLSDPDERVKLAAVQAGGMLAAPELVDRALQDADPVVFLAAARFASTPSQIAGVAARLPSLPGWSRVAAIEALSRHDSDIAYQTIVAALAADEVPVIVAAIEALTVRGRIEDGPAYEQLLQHAHPTVRRSAVRASAHLPATRQVAIAERALADADSTVQTAAAERLQQHPSPDSIAGLLNCLGASDRQLGLAARAALAAAIRSGDAPVEQITALLSDAEPARRADGSAILGLAQSTEAVEKHLQLIDDPSAEVTLQAIVSLGRIGWKPAGGRIAEVILRVEKSGGDWAAVDRPDVIGAAFIACGQLGEPSVLPVARAIAPQKTSCPYSIRGPAIWAIGALGSDRAAEVTPQLLSIFRDNSPYEIEPARVEAMRAIGNLGDRAIIDEVIRESEQQPLPALRWMAHRVRERLAGGQTIAYTPPTARVRPELSIEDLPAVNGE